MNAIKKQVSEVLMGFIIEMRTGYGIIIQERQSEARNLDDLPFQIT